jgi:hypothetical protein
MKVYEPLMNVWFLIRDNKIDFNYLRSNYNIDNNSSNISLLSLVPLSSI